MKATFRNLYRKLVVPIADHLLKRFLRYSVWLAVLTLDFEQEKFQTAGAQSGKQIRERSNTHSHRAQARFEM